MTEKLQATNYLRRFVADLGKETSITLPFDSRKSRKLKRISQWIASDAHTYMAWAAPAILLIRVMREPTWAKCRRVCSRFLLPLLVLTPINNYAQTQYINRATNPGVSSPSPTGEDQGEAFKTYTSMPQIIKTGGGVFSKGELLRINPNNNTIESSSNGGRSWVVRCNNSSYGTFRDLLVYGKEILAATSKGIYVSTNAARSFSPRCTNTSSYGAFINLQDEGKTLLANTTKGLYYSTNAGRSWVRR